MCDKCVNMLVFRTQMCVLTFARICVSVACVCCYKCMCVCVFLLHVNVYVCWHSYTNLCVHECACVCVLIRRFDNIWTGMVARKCTHSSSGTVGHTLAQRALCVCFCVCVYQFVRVRVCICM